MENSLKSLRLYNKKTLAEVATELKVNIRTVLRYEQGVRKISLEQVLILAHFYECAAEEIIIAQLNSCR